jgi:hypothetical protein
MQVILPWMEHQPQAYRALCVVCASQEWIAMSNRSQHRQHHQQNEVVINHTYGANGHIWLVNQMVSMSYSNLLTKEISLNSYIYRSLKLGLSRVQSMFICEGIGGETVKTPKSYAAKRPLSDLLVVVKINVFLPYNCTSYV